MARSASGNQAQPISIRLRKPADLLVADEVRRSGRSRSAVVEELASEAAKTRIFGGIAFRGNPRRAWVIGTGLDVWEIAEMLGSYDDDAERLSAAHPRVTPRHLRLARAYAERFPEDVQPFLEENRRPLDELLQLYPFLETGR